MTYARTTRPNVRGLPTFRARRCVGVGCRCRMLPLRRATQSGLLRADFSFYVGQTTTPQPPPRPPRVTRPFPPPPTTTPPPQVTISVKPPSSDAADVQYVGEEFGRPWFLVSPSSGHRGRDLCPLCQAFLARQAPTTAGGGGTTGDATQGAVPPPPVRLSARGRFSFTAHLPQRRRQNLQTPDTDFGSGSNSTDCSECHTQFRPDSDVSSNVSCKGQTPVQEQHDDVAQAQPAANAQGTESSSLVEDLKDDTPSQGQEQNCDPPQDQDRSVQLQGDRDCDSEVQNGGRDSIPPEPGTQVNEFLGDGDVEMTDIEEKIVENVDATLHQVQNVGIQFPEKGGENGCKVNLIRSGDNNFQIQGQTEDLIPTGHNNFHIQGQTEDVQLTGRQCLTDRETEGRRDPLQSIGEHGHDLLPAGLPQSGPLLEREEGRGCDQEVINQYGDNDDDRADERDSGSLVEARNVNETLGNGVYPEHLVRDGYDDGIQLPGYDKDFQSQYDDACRDKVEKGNCSSINGDNSPCNPTVAMQEETCGEEDCLNTLDLRSVNSHIHNEDYLLQSEDDNGHQDDNQLESDDFHANKTKNVFDDKNRHDTDRPRADCVNFQFQREDTTLKDRDAKDKNVDVVYSPREGEYGNENYSPQADGLKDAGDGADSKNIQLPKVIYKKLLIHYKRTKVVNKDGEVEICSDDSKCPVDKVNTLDNRPEVGVNILCVDATDEHSIKETAATCGNLEFQDEETVILGKHDNDHNEVEICTDIFQPRDEECDRHSNLPVGDGVAASDDGEPSVPSYKNLLMIYKDSSVQNLDEVQICGDEDGDNNYCPHVVGVSKKGDGETDCESNELPTCVYRKLKFQSKPLNIESDDDVIAIENEVPDSKWQGEVGDDKYHLPVVSLKTDHVADTRLPRALNDSRVESEDNSDDDLEILSVDSGQDQGHDCPINYCLPVMEPEDGPSDRYHQITQLPRAYKDSTIETEDDDYEEIDICSGESTHQGQDGDEDYRPGSVKVKKQTGDATDSHNTRLPRTVKRNLRSQYKDSLSESEYGNCQDDVERCSDHNHQIISTIGTTEDVDDSDHDSARSRRAVLRNLRRRYQIAYTETNKKAKKK